MLTVGNKVVMPAARLTSKNAVKANGTSSKATMWYQRNVTGYNKLDLNRDGKVDAEDRSIMYNNGDMDNYVQ
jgi:hypothetical protein